MIPDDTDPCVTAAAARHIDSDLERNDGHARLLDALHAATQETLF